MTRNAIIGLGNPLRQDDGIGVILLHQLKEHADTLPLDLTLVDAGTPGMNLLHLLTKYNKILLIDAINLNQPPGTSRCFTLNDITQNTTTTNKNPHTPNILQVIKLSQQLDEQPDELYFFGIQPHSTSYTDTLSTTLQRRLPTLLQTLTQEISRIFN